jgi:signal transduction histidine kinase
VNLRHSRLIPVPLQRLPGILVLAGVYVALARLGLMIDAVSGFATLIWAPSGLALAVLLRFGPVLWPGVFLGALAANAITGAPLPVALAIAVGNTSEALAGAYGLRRLRGFDPELVQLRDVLMFVGFAALAATLIAATVGTTALAAGGLLEPDGFAATWRAWWIGDALGILLVTPALLVWTTPRHPERLSRGRMAEAAALGLILVLLSLAVFWFLDPLESTGFSQPISLVPVLLWAALRFPPRGGATAILVVAVAAIAGAVLGRGPYADQELYNRLELMQAFLGIVAVTMLILVAIVTERQQVAGEREAALRRAEEAVRLRDETLAVVSHDLRNPLNAVSLTANSLAKRAGDAALKRQVELIERAAARMTRLIQDLLDSAAIAVGRLAIVRALYDPRDIVLEAVETGRALAAERDVELVAACPPRGWRSRCDRERMLQVLSNLISNAIKASPEGANVSVTASVENDETVLAVRDRGPGIPPDEGAHVFERYWRGAGQQGEGAGLGLYIARGIVEAHDGRIWHTPADGGGVVFLIAVPGVYPARRSRA